MEAGPDWQGAEHAAASSEMKGQATGRSGVHAPSATGLDGAGREVPGPASH